MRRGTTDWRLRSALLLALIAGWLFLEPALDGVRDAVRDAVWRFAAHGGSPALGAFAGAAAAGLVRGAAACGFLWLAAAVWRRTAGGDGER